MKNKGITLIALVITIIVLLILAGVAIAMLSGENGILKKAADAKTKTEQAQKEEDTTLTDMEVTTEFLTNNIKYKIKNGYMTGFEVGTKVDKINEELKLLGYEINLKYDYENGDIDIENKANENIATGMSVQKDGKTVARTIIVGDISGDGAINSIDVVRYLKYMVDEPTIEIEDWEKVAMDLNFDGKIDGEDYDLFMLEYKKISMPDQNKYAYNAKDIKVDIESWKKRIFINDLKEKIKDSTIYVLENEQGTENYNLKVKSTESLKVEEILKILPDGGTIKRNEEEVATTENVENGDKVIYKYKEGKEIYIGKIIIE